MAASDLPAQSSRASLTLGCLSTPLTMGGYSDSGLEAVVDGVMIGCEVGVYSTMPPRAGVLGLSMIALA
jgi:hypothetical protein